MQRLTLLLTLTAFTPCGCTPNTPQTAKNSILVDAASEAVLESLITEINSIVDDYPELKDFPEAAQNRPEPLEIRFWHNVRTYAEMRDTYVDDLGEYGIELGFCIRDPDNLGWFTPMSFDKLVHLKNLNKSVWTKLLLSANPSPGLEQKLRAILDRHRKLLENLDEASAAPDHS